MRLKDIDVKTIYDAKAKPLSAIFGDADAFYEVPDYQRAYSWDKDEIQDLWDDIFTAYKESRAVYFLGSIIVAKGESTYKEVIDGQQRLTTLMILFCTIRDLYFKGSGNTDDLSLSEINDAIKSSRGKAYRLRLKTQSNYQAEFDQEILENIKFLENSKAHKNSKFINAVSIFKENLEQNFKKSTELEDFISYLFNNVAMVIIECYDRASAINLFQILNTRGLPLHNSDLIKSYLYRRLDPSKKSEFHDLWTQITNNAKNLEEELDSLFTYYEYYLLGSNPKKSLYEELETKFDKQDPSVVIYDFKKFVDNLIELDKTKSTAMNSLKYLKNQVFWKSILITAKKEGFVQIEDLTKELRRFFYCYWLAGYTTSKVKQTAFNLIVMIKEKKSLEEIKTKINKEFLEDKVIGKINQNLNDDNVYEQRWLKPLLLLIEDERKDRSAITFYPLKKLDADHILPGKWAKIADWTKEWSAEDAKACLNSLGNFTLIMYDKNRSAQNCGFEEKKNIYKGQGKYKGETAFNISVEVAQESFWKKEQVQNRQNKLLKEIEGILEIDFTKAIKETEEISEISYWLTPVSDKSGGDAIETIKRLVEINKIWALSESNQQKDSINVGDLICFYVAGIGIVADAKIASNVEKSNDPNVKDPDRYSYVFKLTNVKTYIDKPIALDLNVRQKLSSFEGKEPDNWSWFVLTTRKIPEKDFNILINTEVNGVENNSTLLRKGDPDFYKEQFGVETANLFLKLSEKLDKFVNDEGWSLNKKPHTRFIEYRKNGSECFGLQVQRGKIYLYFKVPEDLAKRVNINYKYRQYKDGTGIANYSLTTDQVDFNPFLELFQYPINI